MYDAPYAPPLDPGDGYMPAQGPPLPAPALPLPPLTILVPAPPDPPAADLIEAAKTYVPEWLKRGIQDNKNKAESRLRLENIFLNKLPLDWWNKSQEELAAELANSTGSDLSDEADVANGSWRSQLTLSIANLILTYADSAFAAIFSTEEWLSVRPESGASQPSTEDKNFSTSDKLAVELMRGLEDTKVRSAVYQLLIFSALYRRCFAKNVWDEQTVPVSYDQVSYVRDPAAPNQPLINPQTGQPYELSRQRITKDEVVRSAPKIQALKPDAVIPDTFATDSDVQSWSGIAHKFETTWHDVVGAYASGRYNINDEEFLEKWPEAGSVSGNEPPSELASDSDREDLTEGDTVLGKLQGYEFQGLIPTDDGRQTECVCTWIVDADCETPESGIMVRLQPGTILRCGRRNISCAEYTAWPDGGLGAAEPNLDLVYVISHLINLIIDNLRLIINAEFTMKRSIANANPDKTRYPGKVTVVDEHDDYRPVAQPAIDFTAAFNGIQWLSQEHQIRSGIDVARSTTREKTAREVGFLEQQMSRPVANRLQMFRENLLDVALTTALAQVQQFGLAGRQIPIKDADGIEQYTELTEEEIRTGRYRVQATLGNSDSTRLAVAQTLERVLQTLANLVPIMAQQGDMTRLWPIVRSMMEKLDVPNLDQLHTKIAPPPPVPPEPEPGAPGPNGNGAMRPRGRGEPSQPVNMDQIMSMLLQMQGADAEGRTGQI